MTRAKIIKLVGHWQEFLGLNHWLVAVDFETPPTDGADACIWRFHSYDGATLYLEEDWKSWDDPRANQLIVHELLHLLTRDLERAWDSVEGHVDPGVWKALDNRFDHELEGAIERLAGRLVELSFS